MENEIILRAVWRVTELNLPPELRSCVCFVCHYTSHLYYILEILYVLSNLCQSDEAKYYFLTL
jgi:hypothetical protein